MRVIFDNIIFYLQNSGGGTIYWLELIRRAKADADIDVYFSEPRGKLNNLFRLALPLKVSLIEKFPIHWLRISNFSIPIEGKFVFHSSYYRISRSKNVINVVTIHDFTSEFYLTGIRRLIHKFRKKNAINKANGIICISNNTKNDLLKFFPSIDSGKIRVIYNGVSEDYFVVSRQNDISSFNYRNILKEKYILYVGHRTSYKNFFIAAESVAKLDPAYIFLIIGEKLVDNEIAKLNNILENRYICLTGIDNETLNFFYNYAFCLIYPSSYEGFGIPILEAMKAGCPVVTTNKSSIPEVSGNAAIIVEKIDAESFSKGILLLNNDILRMELIEKGLIHASKFSWNRTYEEVKNFYFELFNQE